MTDVTLIAYWVCFLVGSGYALVSALMTGFFGAFGGHDVGGGHDLGGHPGGDYGTHVGDASGHGHAYAAGEDAEAVISPLSPATISIFMTTFGGVGIILTTMFHLSLFLSLPISIVAGLSVAAVVATIFYHLFTKVQASSEARVSDIIGLTAEVTVPIPDGGMGEIAYVCRGARLVSPARCRDGGQIGRHETVRIVRQVGTTFYVEPCQVGHIEPAAPPSDDKPIRD